MYDTALANDMEPYEVQMTPIQCNAVIIEKLAHLKPVMEFTLAEMQRLRESLSNGDIHWSEMLERAIKKQTMLK